MKYLTTAQTQSPEMTRLGRMILHLRCLVQDHKYRWHLAGIWREVTLH